VLEITPPRSIPLGAKGAGEGGIIAPGVMANAVADALSRSGRSRAGCR